MSELLIKNAHIQNGDGQINGDILITDGIITKIEPHISIYNQETETIDASGYIVIPGGIDPHVHMHLPTPAGFSSDNFVTGSKAAIAGGTTSIIDFVTPKKGQSLNEAFTQRLIEAKDCLCNYSFHVSPITWNNEIGEQMEHCVNHLGLNSFKTYLAYKDSIGVNWDELEQIMIKAAELKALVTVHAEDGDKIKKLRAQYIKNGKTQVIYHALSRQAETEYKAVDKAIHLAKKTGCSLYVVHVSSAESIKLIKKSQNEGFNIYAETCPQYLMYNSEVLDKEFYQAAPFVFSPALKSESDRLKLWDSLADNSIQTVGTDHCPFNLYGQKDLGKNDFTKIANGAGGVEHRLELLYTYGVFKKKISMQQMVSLTSATPANIFNLNKRGALKENYIADIVFWNPKSERTISVKNQYQNCDHNIYEGTKTIGRADVVIINGEIIYHNESFNVKSKGKFIRR